MASNAGAGAPTSARVYNFNAGPAALPESVLLEAQAAILNYKDSGVGVMEMSHRSAEFEKIIAEAEADCRKLLDIPASYRVLFMQGGGTTQFSAVPLNLCRAPDTHAHYLVTGSWSQAAEQEARKYTGTQVISGVPTKDAPKGSFTTLPTLESVKALLDDAAASIIYTCANETVHGVEWGQDLEQLFEPEGDATASSTSSKPVLVSDMSSSFMSQPVDVARYGLIYAGAQKNVGPAGLTLVIVRDSLLRARGGSGAAHQASTPLMLQYALQADKGSMYNTPPCWSIYVTGLVFKHLLKQGGLQTVAELNKKKAELLYKTIDESNGFYRAFVSGAARSRMNVVFTVNAAGSSPPARDDKLNALLVAEAEKKRMIGLAGHRSVGGLRASLYNAVSLEAVQALVAFMQNFQKQHTQA